MAPGPGRTAKAQARKNRFGSSTKTLRRTYTPRDLQDKKPEVIIKFTPNGQISGPGSSPTTSSQNKPTNQMVIWYHSLGETEKQIKGLRLHSHETSGYSPFVTLAMNDNSFMLLEASQDEGPRVQSVDVIRLTEYELKFLSPGSIHVDFFPSPNNPNAFVNLRLVIAICQEFLAHILSSDISGNRKVCSRLFAITLFVSVVRQRLPVNSHLIESIRTIAAVDDLWAEILSPEFVGQMLWENQIVDRAHRTIQTGIRQAARDQLEDDASLLSIIATHGQIDHNSADQGTQRLHLIKVIVAWLESTVHPRKPCISNSWDAQWNIAWAEEWDDIWKKEWGSHSNCHHFDIVRAPLMAHDQLSLTNTLLGRAAGRAMIELESVSNSVEPKVGWSFDTLMTMHAREPGSTGSDNDGQSRPSIQITPPVEGTNADTPKARPRIEHLHRRSWFESWHSMRRPDSELPEKWLPVWEAARNLAWTLEWANRPEQEINSSREIVSPTQVAKSQSVDEVHSPSSLSPQRRPQLPNRSSSARLSALFSPGPIDVYGRLKQLTTFSPSSQEDITPTPRKRFEPDLKKLSKVAWDKAHSLDPSLEQYIQDQGKLTFEFCQDEMDTNAPLLSWEAHPLTEAAVTEVLRQTLEKTWQASWESAWKRVMDDASSELKRWMPAGDGDAKVLAPNVRELKHYKALADYMMGGNSKEDNRWHIRSAFKALNLLHRFMAHSVPQCYEGAMKIKRFVDKPHNAEYSISGPDPKTQKITRSSQEYKEEPMSHRDLQDTIQRLARKATKSLPNYDPIKSMEEVWNKASRVNADQEFMNNDPKIPWSEREARVRAHLKRKKFLRFQWKKALRSVLGASKPNSPTQTQPGATPSGTQENGNNNMVVVRRAGLR